MNAGLEWKGLGFRVNETRTRLKVFLFRFVGTLVSVKRGQQV